MSPQSEREPALDEPADEGVQRLGASGRTYSSRSCFLLPTDNPVRRVFIDFVEWPWFDRTVLLLICLNCAFLAVQGPPGYKDAPFHEATAGEMEMFFQVMFTVEMLCKWVAMGLVAHKTAYARDGWNMLDMTVVIAGWVPIILEAPGLPTPNPDPNPNPSLPLRRCVLWLLGATSRCSSTSPRPAAPLSIACSARKGPRWPTTL